MVLVPAVPFMPNFTHVYFFEVRQDKRVVDVWAVDRDVFDTDESTPEDFGREEIHSYGKRVDNDQFKSNDLDYMVFWSSPERVSSEVNIQFESCMQLPMSVMAIISEHMSQAGAEYSGRLDQIFLSHVFLITDEFRLIDLSLTFNERPFVLLVDIHDYDAGILRPFYGCDSVEDVEENIDFLLM